MINQATVVLGAKERNLFLYNKLCFVNEKSSPIHRHRYTEVHIISEGIFEFNVDGSTCSLSPGSVIMIPPETPHFRISPKGESCVISFLVDAAPEHAEAHSFPAEILSGFLREIRNYEVCGNFVSVAPYISFICAPFFKDELVETKKITDYEHIIENFFEEQYTQNATLDELAAVLHVSSRHASRLVQKHTGNSFKQEMFLRKMLSAELLLKTSDMSMSEIAEHLGYSSYGSFWKAYRNYKEQTASDS